MLRIHNSRRFTLRNVSLVDSPFWTVVPTYSEGIVVAFVNIAASTTSPNTDGVEPMWSRDVHIHDVAIVNGDDCITVKSGTSNVLAERITCRGSHGITVGSVWYDDVVNVTYRDVILTDCHAGPRIKGRSQGNATVRDIIETVVQIDMLYETRAGSTNPSAGVLARNCTFENVTYVHTDTLDSTHRRSTAARVVVAASLECCEERPCDDGRLRCAACTREMQRVGGSARTY
jgi:polygalacturonase